MANAGHVLVLDNARSYEDLASLKKWIKSQAGPRSYATHGVYNYDTDYLREFHNNFTQTTTGSAAEFESGAGTSAIAQIGSTEVTLELTCSTANDASHNAVVFTLTYKDRDGVSHTTTATGTATLFATPVAFSPAASDVYCVTAFTASADFDNRDIYAKVNAGAVYATITAAGTVTAATEAQLLGVGAVYMRGTADHADSDGKLGYMCYMTPWGEIKYGHCTLTATGNDEIRFFEAADDGDGTTTATTTTVKDFWMPIWWNTSAAATANTNFIITDADCANVDGSGGDVYAAILNGESTSVNTRIRAPYGYHTWLCKVRVSTYQVNAGDSYTFKQYYTPAGREEIVTTDTLAAEKFVIEYAEPILLKEGTDAYCTIVDNATACSASIDIWAVMCKYNA